MCVHKRQQYVTKIFLLACLNIAEHVERVQSALMAVLECIWIDENAPLAAVFSVIRGERH